MSASSRGDVCRRRGVDCRRGRLRLAGAVALSAHRLVPPGGARRRARALAAVAGRLVGRLERAGLRAFATVTADDGTAVAHGDRSSSRPAPIATRSSSATCASRTSSTRAAPSSPAPTIRSRSRSPRSSSPTATRRRCAATSAHADGNALVVEADFAPRRRRRRARPGDARPRRVDAGGRAGGRERRHHARGDGRRHARDRARRRPRRRQVHADADRARSPRPRAVGDGVGVRRHAAGAARRSPTRSSTRS